MNDKTSIIFCNVSDMASYNFNTTADIPQNGGKFTLNNKNVGEQINFYKHNDGVYRGYVAINDDTKKKYNLNIDRISGCGRNAEKVEGVTVVFCTKKSSTDNTAVIVGWYKNATVYRKPKDFNYNGVWKYFFETKEATLLDKDKRTFTIPRKNGHDTGFGQSNIWYADNGKKETLQLIADVLKYI